MIKKILSFSDFKLFSLLFIFCLLIYLASIAKVSSIIWGDSLYYYSTTRSIVLDRDIDFQNEAFRQDFGFPNLPEVSDVTGRIYHIYSPGTSIMWMPAFVVGYLISWVSSLVGLLGSADGYSYITQFFVAVSALFFSVLGLYFVYRLVHLFFRRKVALLTTLFMFLATPMFYYTAMDPLNSHSASFMLSAALLFFVAKFSHSKNLEKSVVVSWQKMLVLGSIAGMILIVRNQDAVILAPVAIYLFFTKNKSQMNRLNNMILFFGMIFLLFSTQLFSTLTLFGKFGSPYLIRGHQLFNWAQPDFFRVLFSFENGLLFFAPGLVLAIYGLVRALLSKNKKSLKISSLLLFRIMSAIALSTFLIQLYIIASWPAEIVGGPYGSRMFISTLPGLALGAAYFVEQNKNLSKFVLVSATVLLVLFSNNLFQTFLMLARF